jgi:glycosyltransferase involved in cell wall biosynthesis
MINPHPTAGATPAVNVLLVEANNDGTIGGSYLMLLSLVKGLDRSKYRPVVLFYSENCLIPQFRAAGAEVHVWRPRIPLKARSGLLRPAVRAANRLSWYVQPFRTLARVARYLRKWKIDLLHLNNSVAGSQPWVLAAKFRGIPCVVHERGVVPRHPWSSRLLARYIGSVICVSDAVRLNLDRQGIERVPKITVHDGLDPNSFVATRSPREVRAELGVPEGARLVGMVGNIRALKGQDVVVRALGSLRDRFPEVACVFVGDVSPRSLPDRVYREELDKLIRSFGMVDRVVFTGYKAEVADYVNAFEILIQASREPEGFGIVVLEGMALQKPVVASKAGGTADIIVDGVSGLFHEPGNSDDLAGKLSLLLANEKLRESVGIAGHERLMQCFTVQRNTTRTQEVYRSVLARSRFQRG